MKVKVAINVLRHSFLSKNWFAICLAVFAALGIVFFFSLMFGAIPINPNSLLKAFTSSADSQTQLIVWELRIPRASLAVAVGALLAVSGAITQGLFRNPLADPALIGVSAGAAAGAGLAIVFLNTIHLSLFGLSLISLGAFLGGMLAVLFVYRIATGPTGTSVATMLLAGIAVSFLAGSISSVFEFIADNEMLRRISLWRMGGLETADDTRVIIAIFTLVAFSIWVPKQYSALNAMLLGESEARHLGINVGAVKRNIIIMVAAGVGVSVALAGSIAFIGLVVPHIVRSIVGPNHRFLIPLSAAGGGFLLLIADTFSRTILAPTELPVGLVTAFIGAPIFISLLRRRHFYGMQ